VGFQRVADAGNFTRAVRRLFGFVTRGDDIEVVAENGDVRHVIARTFPISIDVAGFEEMSQRPDVQARAAQIRTDLGNPKTIMLGVDRLDYTKGIDVRLKAITELLDEGRAEDCVFIQIATPSRENVQDYQRMRDEIEQMVGRAIGDYGAIGRPPIQYLHQPLAREELVAYYLAADVMLITPYRDGMNLVAKEYVACHPGGEGALVLSEFTGAALDLPGAFLVNPYDAEGVKDAIVGAMTASDEVLRRRMVSMRASVFEYDVDRWAREFLRVLAGEDRDG
jgi:trehalose 6-phosphate synthase/phosphatase